MLIKITSLRTRLLLCALAGTVKDAVFSFMTVKKPFFWTPLNTGNTSRQVSIVFMYCFVFRWHHRITNCYVREKQPCQVSRDTQGLRSEHSRCSGRGEERTVSDPSAFEALKRRVFFSFLQPCRGCPTSKSVPMPARVSIVVSKRRGRTVFLVSRWFHPLRARAN